MSASKIVLIVIFAAFGVYSTWVMMDIGYLGIFEAGMSSWGSLQVFIDLVIALLLICGWMIMDAREKGRQVAPFILLTLLAGSFGPLLYLILAKRPAVKTV